MPRNKPMNDAMRAHYYACQREAEALRKRAAHAARNGDERRANMFASKARQFEKRATLLLA
jgi:DNA-binding ferritin-like protein